MAGHWISARSEDREARGVGGLGELPRRGFLAALGWGSLAAGLTALGAPLRTAAAASGGHAAPTPGLTPDEALKRLMAGNERYVARKARHPNQTAARRAEMTKGQHPFAIVLGCADSRVPPENVFDQGLGDLFVVRVAGNIADDAGIGSIEYAVEHLGVRLVLVLGHAECGAVAAALEAGEKGVAVPGYLGRVVQAILPAVHMVKDRPGDRLDHAVRANVGLAVGRLKASEPVLAAMAKEGKLAIVGGRYDLRSGRVEILA